MRTLYFILAHLFEQKANPKVKTTKQTESRSILVSANGRFIGVMEV